MAIQCSIFTCSPTHVCEVFVCPEGAPVGDEEAAARYLRDLAGNAMDAVGDVRPETHTKKGNQ